MLHAWRVTPHPFPRGADSSALVYSLIETAKANHLEPWAYLRYLFAKLPQCQSDDEMRALLPHRVDPKEFERFDPGGCLVVTVL